MSSENPDTRQWFLRIAGKTIFGPVSTPGIVVWAEQGRILPGHEVSTDRQAWLPAETVPELDIAWYIDDGAGNLRGPLNRIAAETILKSGKAPAGARLVPAKEADLSHVVRPKTETRPAEARSPEAPPGHPEAEDDGLRQRLAALEADLARQKEALTLARQAAKQSAALERERDTLTLSLADAEQRRDAEGTAFREKLAAAERERDAARQERDALATERDAARANAAEAAQALATAETALAAARAHAEEAAQARDAADRRGKEASRQAEESRDRAAQAERAQEAAAAQIAELQARVSESEGAYNDLLTFSNTREHELQSQIEELSKPLSPVARAADACAADPGGALAHILGQEVDLLEKDLAQEREAMANLREWSAQRQQALQARIHELGRILNGGADPGAVRDAGRDGAGRIRTPDATRLQAEMDTLRATHAQAMRTAEERVTDLTRKLRTLENEEVRLRAHATETDKLTRANQELTETIRRREQEVGQERKNREVERENFAATQQALLRRIEQLERSSDDKEPMQESAAANPSLREIASVRPQRPNLAPWFRLKR